MPTRAISRWRTSVTTLSPTSLKAIVSLNSESLLVERLQRPCREPGRGPRGCVGTPLNHLNRLILPGNFGHCDNVNDRLEGCAASALEIKTQEIVKGSIVDLIRSECSMRGARLKAARVGRS